MRVDGDGLHVRQSDINMFLQCPEQARRVWSENVRSESDAALVGTTLHAVIEHELTEGPFKTLAAALQHGLGFYHSKVDEFTTQGVPFKMESFKTHERAFTALDGLIRDWWNSFDRKVFLKRDDLKVEWEFDVPLYTHTNGTKVWLTGTSDLLVGNEKMIDWKSAGSQYAQWEKQRWAIQPTVYTFAASSQGLLLPDSNGNFLFEYKVFLRGNTKYSTPQSVPVLRNANHFAWLESVVDGMLGVYFSDLEKWPLNDQHVLCGPKWCPVWDTCKGTLVDGNKWL